ncbi:hypothetical protein F5X99DRAFT_390375 [Biscogniauxia marginata]|nr:hypothetical protein F5X99DRAFT_390375 [Biscogniauxia marginata]
MARAKMPPTPASSTEIKGQDHSNKLSPLQLAFELPPSAIGPGEASRPPSSGSKMSPVSPSSKPTFPVQPSETVKSRRRLSGVTQKDIFALPPPPTRSRKIIQMKPRPQEKAPDSPATPKATASAGSTARNTSAAGSKKKQPSATSAAGRKIARKTAHSLIERRRRSKMNEEFGVLKELIPACTGDMHKLAILQASIEYIRYLEECITRLKSQHDGGADVSTPPRFDPALSNACEEPSDNGADEEEDQPEPEDVEMTDEEATSATWTSTAARSSQSSTSPALVAQDARGRQHSYSSVSTDYRHYSFSASTSTSPACGPQTYPYPAGATTPTAPHPVLTSPALRPQQELDQEASAALLMLNVDRRGASTGGGGGRGMSVRDLLSS